MSRDPNVEILRLILLLESNIGCVNRVDKLSTPFTQPMLLTSVKRSWYSAAIGQV